jgi:adenosylmethionine-8-amino-7-oxononanoate aminotransferase
MAFWHPFADMGAVARDEFIIDRGEGPWVFDEAGERYLDGTASLWYANLGHGRTEIAGAVAAQMKKIEAYHTFADVGNRPANAICEALAERAPMENAARRHFVNLGQPERVHLISRSQGYHGTHGFGTSLGGIEANVANWGPLVPQTSSVPFDSLSALEEEIRRVGPDKVAAFFCEPVIGAGGVHLPPDGYIQGVADVCAEHGILLVIDAVICAFGRLGTWFGVERWPDVKPAMITFAKGVTSGYLPLGGVVVSETVAAPYFEAPGGPMFRHGATYAGHPSVCAAALATIEIYEREDIIRRGQDLEGPLHDALKPLAAHAGAGEVRGGLGFLAAVSVAPGADAGAVARLAAGARKAGVLVRPLLGGVAVSPPLICEQEHIDLLAQAIEAGLDDVAAG